MPACPRRSAGQGPSAGSAAAPGAGALNSAVLAQTEADARGCAFGRAQVQVMRQPEVRHVAQPELLARGHAWRRDALGRPVVLAAITREGEEAGLLQRLGRDCPQAAAAPLLLLVPRHPQRFDDVAALANQAGAFPLRCRSSWGDGPPPPRPRWPMSGWATAWARCRCTTACADVALAGRQLCAAGRAEPDRGRGLRLPAGDGPAHLQLSPRRPSRP
jgi:3-deoxy-D-manno-octulosonic-acid transferase